MNAVPVHQALFWPDESPVSVSGEVNFRRLALGLARVDYREAPHGPVAARAQGAAGQPFAGRKPLAGRPPLGGCKPYSCAQHAVVTSRAVETLAVLNLRERRVLAMHAWLADIREAELRGGPGRAETGARKRLALRFMDLEALADVLACTLRWDGRNGQGAGPAPGAMAADGLLMHLAGLEVADRNRLALHALFSELLPAGLDGEAPAVWVEILRFVRRMADETARRDAPGGPCIERTGFPALAVRIEPVDARTAARQWFERYRVLSGAAARKERKDAKGGRT